MASSADPALGRPVVAEIWSMKNSISSAHVLPALRQRGDPDRHDPEPMEKVLPEPAGGDLLGRSRRTTK